MKYVVAVGDGKWAGGNCCWLIGWERGAGELLLLLMVWCRIMKGAVMDKGQQVAVCV